jgi:hypothetical protein
MDSINLKNMNNNNYNEEIIKEKDKKINDLNKTIESLTKENQQLKLKLLKVNNFQNEIDELNKIIEEEKIKYSDLNNLYLEEIHKNEMLNVEMKINEKEGLRQNRATLRESGMMDIQMSNLGASNNIFNNISDNDNDPNNDSELIKKNKEFEKKDDELENQIMILRKELDLKEINKSTVSKEQLEEIKKEKYLLQSELDKEKEKNLKASEKIIQLKEKLEESIRASNLSIKDTEKAKKYNIFLSYIKQVVDVWKPIENKEQFLYKKLKEMIEMDQIK